jgi:hypothetical protein
MCFLLITFLLQDILIMSSFFVRKINMKALNKYFMLQSVLDLTTFALAILLLVKYNDDNGQSRNDYPTAEKNYRFMLDATDGDFGSNVQISLLFSVLIFRLLHILIYNKAVGYLVQITIAMLTTSMKFILLCLIVLITFTIVGLLLFSDMEEFKTFYLSFNSMYAFALGGFDFEIFTNEYRMSSTSGRVFLGIFLLIAAILLLNFLIAIMADAYANYGTYINGLQMNEIIKLRSIYEEHRYYHCLSKSTILFSFLIFPFMPFVMFFKSEKLNKFLLHVEYFPVMLIQHIVNDTIIITFSPIFAMLGLAIKLKEFGNPRKGLSDKIFRLFDIALFFILTPIIIVALLIPLITGNLLSVYASDNMIKVVEPHRREYEYVNRKMDGSIQDNNNESKDINSDQFYHAFKRFIAEPKSVKNSYDPSNRMISESILMILLGTLKILRNTTIFQEPDDFTRPGTPIFLPTSLVIKKLLDYMFVEEHVRALVYGEYIRNHSLVDTDKISDLAKALADFSLGGMEADIEEIDEYQDDGKNLVVYTAQ